MFEIGNKINHSVCSWTYSFLTLNELCSVSKNLGIRAIDLVAPKDFYILQEHNIECSMCYTAGKVSLTQGWNDPLQHEWLIKDYKEAKADIHERYEQFLEDNRNLIESVYHDDMVTYGYA